MMIGLVVFGGVNQLHGMSWFNKSVKPHNQQGAGCITRNFVHNIFRYRADKAQQSALQQAHESRQGDLANKLKGEYARSQLANLAAKKHSQFLGAGLAFESRRQSWRTEPASPRFNLVETNTPIHAEVLAMYSL